MAIFNIILGHNAIVDNTFLRKKVHRIGLLKQCITNVLFILQYLLKRLRSPFRLIRCGEDAVRFQTTRDLEKAGPFKLLQVSALYQFCFFRDYDQALAFIFGVA